jgi:type I restriction-modification system DNA methylase subunit
VNNANFAWVQHIIHHLAPTGLAGFVLANGSMSSNQSGEGEIRKNIIEADLVDCMVALPDKLFYSTQIPACLWFLARDKRNGRFRDRRGQVLFIDARRMGRMVDRVHRELTDEDIRKIADTYHAWRGDPTRANTRTSPAFARARRWRKSASTAMSSLPAATSVPLNRNRKTNRSTRKCDGWWRNCASNRPKPPNSTPPSPPTSRSWASGR